MERAAEQDFNTAPMPQMQQKGNESPDGTPSEKRTRFSQKAQDGGVMGDGAAGKRNRRRNRGSLPSSGAGGANNSVMHDGGGPGGPVGGRGGEDFFIGQKLRNIAGPTLELPPVEVPAEVKFAGRNTLYVGNLPGDITDTELRDAFKPYGEIDEISKRDKNYAFLKVDFLTNAKKAKRDLDGSMLKGRKLRVQFATNATILRVSNLTQYVTNELLYISFEIFGPIERAYILVDDHGRHTGEGIVEFAKKSSAFACLRLCSEKCFFLTASLRPCLVEPMVVNDDTDGVSEKSINKAVPEFCQERSIGPRLAHPNSFEHEYGSRWKQLHDVFKRKQEALKSELKIEEDKLEYFRHEYETERLRQELRKREAENERKKWEWEMHEKRVEDMRIRQDMQNHMMIRQEVDTRRLLPEDVFGGDGNKSSSFDNVGANSSSSFDVFKGTNNNKSTTQPI